MNGPVPVRFNTGLRAAGLDEKIHFHSLRHTFASWLIQKDVPLYQVSKLLGHSSIAVTEIYSHLRTDDLSNAISVLDR
jgi:site-specific recombinase XerD